MFKKNEMGVLVLASLIIGFVISFKQLQAYEWQTLITFAKSAGLALITIALCMTASKLAARSFGCNAEFRLWTMHRYWFHRSHYLKKPIPTWLLFPLFLIFTSWGYIKWLALFVFDTSHTTRVLKEKDYTHLTEWELALIAFFGLLANIILAIVSKFMGWNTLASLNIWFVFFNLLPFSELNGMKIIHGSVMLWIFSIILTSIIIILLGITSALTTIIAAVAVAITAVLAWFHFFER